MNYGFLKEFNLKKADFSIKFKLSRVLNYPFYFFLEPTTRCNLDCEICARHYDNNINKNAGDISEELIEKSELLFKYSFFVQLTGYGEPFLLNKIDDLINLSAKYKCYGEIITNGMSLNKENIEKLVTGKFYSITFSIDSLNQELLKKIRKPADISVISETINKLNECKKKYNSTFPLLWINFVLQKQNFSELKNIVMFSIINKINLLTISQLSFGVDGLYGEYYKTNSLKNIDPDELKKVLEEIGETANLSNLNLKINIDLKKQVSEKAAEYSQRDFYSEKIPDLKPFYCVFPWTTFYVCRDGKVKPCCFMAEPLDEINTKSIKGVWNGKAFKQLRKTIKQGKVSQNCIYCVQNGFYINSYILLDKVKKIMRGE